MSCRPGGTDTPTPAYLANSGVTLVRSGWAQAGCCAGSAGAADGLRNGSMEEGQAHWELAARNACSCPLACSMPPCGISSPLPTLHLPPSHNGVLVGQTHVRSHLPPTSHSFCKARGRRLHEQCTTAGLVCSLFVSAKGVSACQYPSIHCITPTLLQHSRQLMAHVQVGLRH